MIYKCNGCQKYTFDANCSDCYTGTEFSSLMVPLDPKFFDEFQYQSKGFFKDIFGKKKELQRLSSLLEDVLAKYKVLKNPFFVNYIHTSNQNFDDVLEEAPNGYRLECHYEQIELFYEVLVRQGFAELQETPSLLNKLLLTTGFSFEYEGFKKEIERHIKKSLASTLKSWVEEVGSLYKQDLPLFLYHIWESKFQFEDFVIEFSHDAANKKGIELVSKNIVMQVDHKAANTYYDILISKLADKLKYFAPDKFVSMHYIDSLSGLEFEDFLVQLFGAIGFEVSETKKTGDQGADLFINRFGKSTVIQAKNYSQNVGNSAVQQVISAKSFYNCDEAMVVTNSFYTKSAIELASKSNVVLKDRNDLQEYLDEYNENMIERFEDDYEEA